MDSEIDLNSDSEISCPGLIISGKPEVYLLSFNYRPDIEQTRRFPVAYGGQLPIPSVKCLLTVVTVCDTES